MRRKSSRIIPSSGGEFGRRTGAKRPAGLCAMAVRTRSENQLAFHLIGFFGADVDDLVLVIVAERVKAEAVLGGIDGLLEFPPEQLELSVVEYTLKTEFCTLVPWETHFFATARRRRLPSAVVVLTSYVIRISIAMITAFLTST